MTTDTKKEPPCVRGTNRSLDWIEAHQSYDMDKTTAANVIKCIVPHALMNARTEGQRKLIADVEARAYETLGDEAYKYLHPESLDE